MRTRESIEAEHKAATEKYGTPEAILCHQNALIVDLLLDIRDLLVDIDHVQGTRDALKLKQS